MPRSAVTVVCLMALVATQLADALRGGDLVGSPVVVLLTVLGGYLVGLTCRGWTTAVCAAAAAAALTAAHQLAAPGVYPVLDDLVFSTLVVGTPAVAGQAVRRSRAQVRALEDAAARLGAQRSTALETAQLEERTRLRMRLHQDFTEQVAAIAMRAESVVDADRGSVRAALEEIEAASRHSLDELRAAIGFLRSHDDQQSTAPPPGPSPVELAVEPAGPSSGGPLRLRDLGLAVGSGAAIAVETVVSPQTHGAPVANVAVALLAAAPLVVRRLHPLAACTASLAALAAMSAWLTPATALVTTIFVVLVWGYTIGAHLRGLRRLTGAGVLLVALTVVAAVPSGLPEPEDVVPMVVFVVLAVLAGAATAQWSQRAAQLRLALAELERGREIEVSLAAAEERSRIASELHDTVAHAMTVICLQAGAGQVRADPEIIDTIVRAARGALRELREGLENVESRELGAPELVALALRAGLRPEVRVNGRLDQLTAGEKALALRVVREAVTNAGRYAPGSLVRIEVDTSEGLRVSIADDGGAAGAPAVGWGSGSGLAGLAAEVARGGGVLTWGAAGSGFLVEARLSGSGVAV